MYTAKETTIQFLKIREKQLEEELKGTRRPAFEVLQEYVAIATVLDYLED